MRILVYGINYSPELTGIGKYTGEMCSWLASQGHEVHVITAMPYYPEWSISKSYKHKGWMKEVLDGVIVHRVPLYVPKTVNSKKRILHEFSFLASVCPTWLKLLFSKKFDWQIVMAPPFHLSLFPYLMKKVRQTKYISHIQDLQVDAAKDLGMIKNSKLLSRMFKMEKFFLNNSDYVSTISLGMQRKIEGKGICTSKIIQFPNWVDTAFMKPMSQAESLRQELGIPLGDKVVLYSGNMGEKQGLDVLIRVAANFRLQKNIHFLICGSGGNKANLMALAKDLQADNIHFLPLQPLEKLPQLLSAADLHLVLQRKTAADLVLPSKLTGILSCGGCALVQAEKGTSLHSIIDTHHLGILIEPESEDSLRKGLQQALSSDLSIYQHNARAYAEQYLNKNEIITHFEQILKTSTEFAKAKLAI